MLIALAAAAFLAGVTGSWSPCGFSMLTTLAPGGNGQGRRGSALGLAAFAPGALLGGVASFAGLALLGHAVNAGGHGALPALAGGLALLAALAEAGNVRVRPQVRRQVPERWRFVMPFPLATFAYGVLLGLGWTTYVLTLAVWVLFALAFALGDPALGLAAGLAFGLGRALPIVLLAPVLDTPGGRRTVAAMAERPGILRGLRALDGAALAACALALAPTAAARSRPLGAPAADPSTGAGYVLWHVGDRGSILLHGGARQALPLPDAAIGGHRFAAHVARSTVVVAPLGTRARTYTATVPAGAALAVSDRWLAWRRTTHRGDRLYALRFGAAGERPRLVAASGGRTSLSRPALAGDRLVFATAGPRGSTVVLADLRRRRRRTLARAVEAQYAEPSLLGDRLLVVRTTACDQELVLARVGGRARRRVLYHAGPLGARDESHEHGYSRQGSEPTKCHPERPRARSILWSTALAPRAAYVILLTGGRGRLLRVPR